MRRAAGLAATALLLAPVVTGVGRPRVASAQAGAASSSFSVVQTTNGHERGGKALTLSFPQPTTRGDMLLVVVEAWGPPHQGTLLSRIADTSGNALLTVTSVGSGSRLTGTISCEGAAPQVTGIVIRPADAKTTLAAYAFEVTGGAYRPADAAMSSSGAGTSPATGTTASTSETNEFVLGYVGWAQSATVIGQPDGWTAEASVEDASGGPHVAVGLQPAFTEMAETGAQSYSATLSASESWTAGVATFRSVAKPDVSGLVDRGNAPPLLNGSDPANGVGGSGFDWPPAGGSDYEGMPISAIVVNETWADLQPNGPDSTIIADATTGTPNAIDEAIADVSAYDNSDPANGPVYIKVRIWAGPDAPLWAKQLDGGPIQGNTSGDTVGTFWDLQGTAGAISNMEAQVATLYDNNPYIAAFVDGSCMGEFDEPLLRSDFDSGTGLANLLEAGYTDTADFNCNEAGIQNWLRYLHHTKIEFTFNPWEMLTVGSGETIDAVTCHASPCEALTEKLMGDMAGYAGSELGYENNSIRYPAVGGPYKPMYAAMSSEASATGATVDFQTATFDKLDCNSLHEQPNGQSCSGQPEDGLSEALNWACGATDQYQTTSSGETASSVELPQDQWGIYYIDVYPPYDAFTTPSSFSSYYACVAKDPH